jgi:FKBP-type peptidyl-prolyl cis-trans isomerase SlyD
LTCGSFFFRSCESNRVQPTTFQVGPDTVVHFSYQLFDAEGECVEGDDGAEFSFLFGYGQLAPALENALLGMQPQQRKRVRLSPEQAFGARDPERVLELDRDGFPPDIAPGDEFEAENEEGDAVTLAILDVDAERVVVDLNHPLAGQDVELLLCVQAVRPALSAEIAEAISMLEAEPKPVQGLLPATRLLRRPSEALDSEDEPESRPD